MQCNALMITSNDYQLHESRVLCLVHRSVLSRWDGDSMSLQEVVHCKTQVLKVNAQCMLSTETC